MVFLLSACGFHLRQEQPQFSFQTIYIDSKTATSEFTRMLRQRLLSRHIKLVSDQKSADMILSIDNERHDKRILSLSGSGRVEEYDLRFYVILHATDKHNNRLIQDEELQVKRSFSYSDSRILAKEAEEAFLQNNMADEMVSQVMLRLGRVKQ